MEYLNPHGVILERLRAMAAHKDLPEDDWFKKSPRQALRYISEKTRLRDLVSRGSSEKLGSAKDIAGLQGYFLEELDFLLARFRPPEPVAHLRQKLLHGQPAEAEDAWHELIEIPDFIAEAAQSPVLSLVPYLPKGFFFRLRGDKVDRDKRVACHKEAERRGIPLPKGLGYSTEDVIALWWILGHLPKAEPLLEFTNQTQTADLLTLFQQAERVYGQRWKKEDADGWRRVDRVVTEWQWEQQNPLWPEGENSALLSRIIDLKPALFYVATREDEEESSFSWPEFLRLLWLEEKTLQARVTELKIRLTHRDHRFKFVPILLKEEAFQPYLVQIGERLEPWAPAPLASDEERAKLARRELEKDYLPGEEGLLEIVKQGAEAVVVAWWQDILRFKRLLKETTQETQLFEMAADLRQGWFRDFFLYEAWKRDPARSSTRTETYLQLMQSSASEGAQANRAQDVMNAYVREHLEEGMPTAFAVNYGLYRAHWQYAPVSAGELDHLSKEEMQEEMNADRTYTYLGADEQPSDDAAAEHQRQKHDFRAYWEQTQTLTPADLYLFTDTIVTTSQDEATFDLSFANHILGEQLTRVESNWAKCAQSGSDFSPKPEAIRDWLTRYIPDACMLRDFYLENTLHAALWKELQTTSLGPVLDAENIQFRIREVDLADHFQNKDRGALKGAYRTRYTLFRVFGLTTKTHLLTQKERDRLAVCLHSFIPLLTPGAREGTERLCIELEAESLHAQYEEVYEHHLPKTHEPTPDEHQAARDRAFTAMLHTITKRFPLASYYRDELLERFALDYAVTEEHVRRVESHTYAYLARQPELSEETKQKTVFAPAEAVKNYLTLFQDQSSRAMVLGWIFGGDMPNDRFAEGRIFHVNANAEREAFWLLSREERKAILYSALMGEKGLFDVTTDWLPQGYHLNQQPFIEFLDVFYTHNIENILRPEEKNTALGRALRTIFFVVFKYYSTPRRIQLFLSLTDVMAKARQSGERLNTGQAIRVFLEQIGVVGIKAGQVLAEQEKLVSPEIRKELSLLRDRATPFPKYGVFTTLNAADLLVSKAKKTTVPDLCIAQVGACLGAASIKQAHHGWTRDNKAVVAKIPRPSIEKNYTEDLSVLEEVVRALRDEGLEVPPHLLSSVVSACSSELDFQIEARHQAFMTERLKARQAAIVLPQTSDLHTLKLSVPQLVYVKKRGEGRLKNLQLMVDEYVPGLSLREVEDYQRLLTIKRRAPPDEARLQEIEEQLAAAYPGQLPRMKERYTSLPLDELRAQLALDLIGQITGDGVFHADLHTGNIRVDLTPQQERVALIDWGSAGQSYEPEGDGFRDHRADFTDFIAEIVLLTQGLGNMENIGRIMANYAPIEGRTEQVWGERLQALLSGSQTESAQDSAAAESQTERFFRSLLADILSEEATIHPQFRFLLKALASAGRLFDALKPYVQKAWLEAATKTETEGGSFNQHLFSTPGCQHLKPLLERRFGEPTL